MIEPTAGVEPDPTAPAIHYTIRSVSTRPLCGGDGPVTRKLDQVTCLACLTENGHREAAKRVNIGNRRIEGARLAPKIPPALLASIDRAAEATVTAERFDARDRSTPRTTWLRQVAEDVATDSRAKAINRAVLQLRAEGYAPTDAHANRLGDIVVTVLRTLPVWLDIPAE